MRIAGIRRIARARRLRRRRGERVLEHRHTDLFGKVPPKNKVGPAFLFDLDGTLVDTTDAYVKAWCEL